MPVPRTSQDFWRELLGNGNPFGRTVSWLKDALDLKGSALPNELATGRVLPVVDVLQGGFTDADVRQFTAALVFGTNDAQVIIPADAKKSRHVIAGYADASAAGQLQLLLVGSNSATNAVFNEYAAAATKAWDALNNSRPLWVPPGFTLNCSITNMVAGDTMNVFLLVLERPAGTPGF